MALISKIRSFPALMQWLRDDPDRLRLFKRALIVFVLLVVAAIAARPVTRAVKGWQARRLAAESIVLTDKQDFLPAGKKALDAYRLRPFEVEAWYAVAYFLSRTGQATDALGWWQQIEQRRPLSLSDRRDYAAAALSANELALASTQIDLLLASKLRSPVDLLLAAQLATVRGDSRSAVQYADIVLSDAEANSRETYDATVVIFSNTAPGSPPYIAASDRLIALARNEESPGSLNALALIGRRPLRPRLTATPVPPLTVALLSNRGTPISRREVAERLERHPNAQPADRLLALDLRIRDEPSRAKEFAGQAIETFRNGDDDALRALASWLYEQGLFEDLLQVVPPNRTSRKRELFLARIDALAALGRFAELEEILLSENSPLDPVVQHMLLAVVRSRIGQTAASTNEWQRAAEAADNLPRLYAVADYAEKNGNLDIADAVYQKVLIKQPRLRYPYMARLRVAEHMGQTMHAHEIATEILKIWPEDAATRARELYLRLLLGVSREEADIAEQQLTGLTPHNSPGSTASAALALARMRSGRPADALRAFAGTPPMSAGAHVVAVHAAALARNGWEEKAREEAKRLATMSLLPEERALIAPLLETK